MAIKRRRRRTARRVTLESRLWRALRGALPAEAHGHLRSARREILLAVRAVVDEAVARRGPSSTHGARARTRGRPVQGPR
jgi:hypothetical protein